METLFMEQLTINHPLFLEPTLIITESVWPETFFKEDVEGIPKKNIFKRLWDLLKKIYGVVAAKVRQIWAWLTGLFKTKKIIDTTIDDIASVGFKDANIAPSKHLKFRYDNDQKIHINIIGNTIKKQFDAPKIVGHDKHDRPWQQATMLIFHIIKHPDLLDPIIEFLTVVRGKDLSTEYPVDRVQKAIDAVWAGTIIGASFVCSMEEWTILNERINKLQEALQLVDDNTFMQDEQYGSRYANVMNQIVSLGAYLQIGINTIADGMRQVYELDPSYHNAITSENFRTKLPDFVKRCVEANIPSKYLSHAVRQISDVSINAMPGDPTTKGDDNAPLKGNGRFVMFPGAEDLRNQVIKVAYNNLGVRGNRNEFVVWDKVKGIPEIADELYHIEDIGDPNNFIILCDRCAGIDNWDGTTEWNKKMKQMCIDNNIGFIIRCNSGGFGKRGDGKVICCDYGNVNRIVPDTV